MYELPTTVETNCGVLHIRDRGDYRMVLDCFGLLDDVELEENERILAGLMVLYEEFDELETVATYGDIEGAINKMYLFFNCNDTQVGANAHGKVVDWQQDSTIICSAIHNVANTEVRALEYLHWFTFMGYYMAIGECNFATVVGIRDKLLQGKKLEKFEQDFKRDNPQYFVWNSKSTEQKEADEWVKKMWNANKQKR